MGLSVNSTYDEIRKYVDELYSPKKAQALADNDAAYKQQSDTVRSLYEGQIADSGQDYDDLERSNAVQKLINEREVAESMANMGLTNSGLNRTQQTAVQLSAANEAAKIKRERQAMVNSLTREMTSMLADIEMNRSNAAQSINQSYDSMIDSAAQEQYQTNMDYKESIEKEYIAAQKAAAEKAADMYHGLTSSQANTVMKYIAQKDYATAERYLDMYGISDNADFLYWYNQLPENYRSGNSYVSKNYGDANGDGVYDVRDIVRAKKQSQAENVSLIDKIKTYFGG